CARRNPPTSGASSRSACSPSQASRWWACPSGPSRTPSANAARSRAWHASWRRSRPRSRRCSDGSELLHEVPYAPAVRKGLLPVHGALRFALLVLAFGVLACAPRPAPTRGEPGLEGTSWALVRTQSADGTKLAPDDPAKYTVAFGSDGASFRIDCNRGYATWSTSEDGQLAFGPLATTRAMCPPGSLYDRVARDMPQVRSYSLRDGTLQLSLGAGGGSYEFE